MRKKKSEYPVDLLEPKFAEALKEVPDDVLLIEIANRRQFALGALDENIKAIKQEISKRRDEIRRMSEEEKKLVQKKKALEAIGQTAKVLR